MGPIVNGSSASRPAARKIVTMSSGVFVADAALLVATVVGTVAVVVVAANVVSVVVAMVDVVGVPAAADNTDVVVGCAFTFEPQPVSATIKNDTRIFRIR